MGTASGQLAEWQEGISSKIFSDCHYSDFQVQGLLCSVQNRMGNDSLVSSCFSILIPSNCALNCVIHVCHVPRSRKQQS